MTNATSKKAIAAAVFATLTAAGKTRKEVLSDMVSHAGLSQAGAATYFNNFKKGLWTLPGAEAVAAPAVDYASMSSKELVELYNARAEKPIAKFRDHATAVRRTAELYAA